MKTRYSPEFKYIRYQRIYHGLPNSDGIGWPISHKIRRICEIYMGIVVFRMCELHQPLIAQGIKEIK